MCFTIFSLVYANDPTGAVTTQLLVAGMDLLILEVSSFHSTYYIWLMHVDCRVTMGFISMIIGEIHCISRQLRVKVVERDSKLQIAITKTATIRGLVVTSVS